MFKNYKCYKQVDDIWSKENDFFSNYNPDYNYQAILDEHCFLADAVIANPDVEVEYKTHIGWLKDINFFNFYTETSEYRLKKTKLDFNDDIEAHPDYDPEVGIIRYDIDVKNMKSVTETLRKMGIDLNAPDKPVNFNNGFIIASQEAYDLLVEQYTSMLGYDKSFDYMYIENNEITMCTLDYIELCNEQEITYKQFYINNGELSWNEPEKEFEGFDFKNTFEEISGGETLDEFCKQKNKVSLDEPNPKPLWHVDFGNHKPEKVTCDNCKESTIDGMCTCVKETIDDLFDLEDTVPMTDKEYEEYQITGKVPASAITRNILETQRIKPTISKMETVQNFSDGYKKGWKDRDKQSDLEDKSKPTQVTSTGNDNSKVDITRIEIIGTEGREFSSRLVSGKYEMNIQDEGRTLKLFEVSTKKQWYENPENFPALLIRGKEIIVITCKSSAEYYLNPNTGYRLATKDEVMSLYWKEK